MSLLDIALKNNSAMKIKKWLKKLFGVKTVSTKKVEKEEIKNEDSIQFGPEKSLLKTSGSIQKIALEN